jgi:hypothetical protein
MPEVRLSAEEAEALRRAMTALAVRVRTGELGVLHGLERFVSTHATFRRAELDALDAAARKLGLAAGVPRTTK